MMNGIGANLIKNDGLEFILMPLVQMHAEYNLSWFQREQIAKAMIAVMESHKSMAEERAILAGKGCGQAIGQFSK